MSSSHEPKSSVDQIRTHFDNDVERFSNIDTGQSATIDAPLALELIAQAAAATTSHARDILDVGCGAGNYALKLLQCLPNCNITLVDLSEPMLHRAHQRVSAATTGSVITHCGDVRSVELGESRFDVIVAAAVLHHLRSDEEWRSVIAKFHRALRAGGTLWICDLIEHSSPAVQQLMWHRYGQYLTNLKDEHYRDQVFAYIQKEDSPRTLMFQIDLLRESGFLDVDILHKNAVFGAFGGRKRADAERSEIAP